ncbi:signal peptidase II [Caulobacter sp. Root1455]|uniref:signal peptidase II n=1 Tax=Caulobacter sp. Root1455 TaxID=1736465 RepID=UPI0006F95274|nr:signal peptidase II [Caulobacter sp. Root1455]KQY93969.1 signal peptidase II [Caulobacter sp. Root1455]
MLKITRLGWTAYAIAIVTVVLDQISKAWILATLGTVPGASQPVAGPFYLTLVHNFGMSFGLFRGSELSRWLLTIFSAVVVVGLAVWARKAVKPLMAGGIGLIIGGAFGNNLIDRIRYGYVVDFIDVSRMHFPWVFNVADSAITVGVCLLLLDSFLAEEKKLANPDGHGL